MTRFTHAREKPASLCSTYPPPFLCPPETRDLYTHILQPRQPQPFPFTRALGVRCTRELPLVVSELRCIDLVECQSYRSILHPGQLSPLSAPLFCCITSSRALPQTTMTSPGSETPSSQATRTTQSTIAGLLAQIRSSLSKPPDPPAKPSDWAGPNINDFSQPKNTVKSLNSPSDTIFTKSQERFQKALTFGIAGLALELRLFAHERLPGSGHEEEGASWQSVVDDLDSDSSNVYAMLLQLPPAIHEHLIAGDLFHAKIGAPRLRRFYDTLMGPLVALPGSYGQAIVNQRSKHRNEGCWLTADESKELADVILGYTTDFTIAGNNFAEDIATATTEPGPDRDKRLKDPCYRRYANTSGLIQGFKKWARLIRQMYYTKVRPADRDKPFTRSPLESGWAKSVKDRLERDHYKNFSANNFVAFVKAWLILKRKSRTIQTLRHVAPIGFHLFYAWKAEKHIAQFTELLAHAIFSTRLSNAAGGELGMNHMCAPWITKIAVNKVNYNLSLARATSNIIRDTAEADARLVQKLHNQSTNFNANLQQLRSLETQITTEAARLQSLTTECATLKGEMEEKRAERRVCMDALDQIRPDETQKRLEELVEIRAAGNELLKARPPLSAPMLSGSKALEQHMKELSKSRTYISQTYEAGKKKALKLHDESLAAHQTMLAQTTGTQHGMSALLPLGSQLPEPFDAEDTDDDDVDQEEEPSTSDEDLDVAGLVNNLEKLSVSWNAIGDSFPADLRPSPVDFKESLGRLRPDTSGLRKKDAIAMLRTRLQKLYLRARRSADGESDSEGDDTEEE